MRARNNSTARPRVRVSPKRSASTSASNSYMHGSDRGADLLGLAMALLQRCDYHSTGTSYAAIRASLLTTVRPSLCAWATIMRSKGSR